MSKPRNRKGQHWRSMFADPTLMPMWMLLSTWCIFAAISPQTRSIDAFVQTLEQSAATGVLAIGMTFVLLTAGIDLSVGAVMLLAGSVAGRCMLAGVSPFAAIAAMLGVGAFVGFFNGVLIARLRMPAFIVTLGGLFLARGAGLWITETRPLTLSADFYEATTTELLLAPVPVWILAGTAIAAHLALTRTPLGRQTYAVGFSAEAAELAGVDVERVKLVAYTLSGLCAALAGVIVLSQLGAVSPTMGDGMELEAIAASVLGGVSLFGGRGNPLGAALGAILFQSIFTGLNIIDADPAVGVDIDEYFYPIITAAIVFVAVLIDSARKTQIERAERPRIRPLDLRITVSVGAVK